MKNLCYFFSEPESSQDRTPTYANQNYPVPIKTTLQSNYPIQVRTTSVKAYATSPKPLRVQQQGFSRREQEAQVSTPVLVEGLSRSLN